MSQPLRPWAGRQSSKEVQDERDACFSGLSAPRTGAPLLDDWLANVECRVADTRLVDTCNLFILEAKRIWIDEARKERRTLHHLGNGCFTIDGGTLDLSDRMTKWRNLP
ncbi:hypothetical protein GCM10007874_34370 [Labrys miyagiensis]|uniref:Flavin reductase like domain-containing protein n=1 Tax=Labrys miyagiensis TaxID=346912 RepID=A0ABQ6CJS9_9HYPH|nr:flavin reductase [Labrys miyagiensis]GLS20420.1 hypothetical protein GCM10007874_34370 [Labrys miyagiensis]